jgi:hypothetical protein
VTLQLPDTPLEKTSYWLAIVPQLPLTGYYQTAWMQSTNYNGTSARQIFEAMDIFPWTPFNVDLAFSIEGEPKCTPTPSSFQFCADANNDGKRDDPCLWYSSCDVFFCFQAPRGYANGGQYGQADMGSPAGANQCEVDGVADANDSFHALRCFSNQNFMGAIGYPCEDNAPPPPQVPKALNVDAGSNASCVLDGICDGNDAFHALRSFSNTNFMGGPGYPCTCPGSETMAAQRVEPREWTGLTLRAPRSARPGELVDVEVFLDSDINHLTGFQLHLGTAGGKATDLELVDISADIQHRNHAYAGVEGTWSAYNRAVGQMVMGVNTLEGFPARAGAYLATFTYRVPANAAGTYAVDVLYGPSESNMENRTYLFGYSSGPIGVTSATPAEIRVSRAREE